MTSLQNLLAEFKGEYSCGGPRCPHEMLEEHDVFTYKQLDDFAANIYSMALQEALGKVPGDFWTNYVFDPEYRDGWNAMRKETIQGIESLIPKKDI